MMLFRINSSALLFSVRTNIIYIEIIASNFAVFDIYCRILASYQIGKMLPLFYPGAIYSFYLRL